MPKDSCYHSVKARYDVFPSARASQAIAKCRKGKGSVRKSDKGTNLKRWQSEKWTDTKTGKACGAGGSNEYCRPKNKVTSKTPKTIGEMSKSELKRKKAEKSKVGMGRRVTSLSSLGEIFELDQERKPSKVAIANLKATRKYNKQVTPKNQQTARMQKLEREVHRHDILAKYYADAKKNKGFLPFGKKARARRGLRKQMEHDVDYVNAGIRQ